ncbi:hypothetical protein AHF37_02385 [Paragonimus kellicotti]|nr:hypothetical protein AHF37_02385 [Paragonimus kellicotti]
MSNRVYVSRNEQHRFLVKFNDRIVDVDQGTVAHQTEFATYTYIGSVDQSSRLPWYVWSRENFAGCIPSIRINDDKFLDPSSRMSQHTDVSRGIQFGVCRIPDRRCTREICGGGRCAERSYPFFEPLNFACECGGSDKTFREGVTDIRRSEGCFRGKIPLQSHLKTFKLVAQQIYLGSAGPPDYARPPPPTSETKFLPPPPRFVGEFRNFYWNEYDFIGTGTLPSKYTTDMLSPRAILPVFPQWPRQPTYSITCTPKLYYSRLDKVIDIQEGGDMWLVEFKTEYEGVLFSTIGNGLPVSRIRQLIFYFGGLPDTEWQTVLTLLRQYSPGSLQSSEAENGKQPTLTGCLGGFSLRADNFVMDLLDQRRCTSSYCRNGRCEQISDREVRCVCNPGYEGIRCESQVLECPPNYCNQRGQCTMINGQPRCDCRGTGYHGERCELNPCSAGGYCYNGGVCTMRGSLPYCDCRGTGFHGEKCRDPICPPNYCFNRGRCVVGPDEKPTCECQGTGFGGPRCDKPVCTADACDNRGRCTVNVYGIPECDCTGTGFTGPRCQTPICTSDHCRNRGRCVVGPNNEPQCDCRGTGYTGERCERSICTEGYCANGGRCTVGLGGQPICDCSGTGYGGSQCTDPVCRPGFCQNGGRCYLDPAGQPTCSCEGTGFSGNRCQNPICSPGYCLNGGRCSIGPNNQPTCSCDHTDYRGSRCETPICVPGFCLHGGLCRLNEARQPVCDCMLTNYQGERCDVPICPKSYCGERGLCVVRQRQPTCDCHPGYRGPRCELEVCPENYCINGGFCAPGPDKSPVCTCPVNYEDYCFHGGRCTMNRGVPQCDCIGTDYTGVRCEIAQTCPAGFCQNGGRCSVQKGNYVCDCTGTGFRGVICTEPLACPPNYCLFGGICTVLPGKQYMCDCSRTGRTGKNCEGSSTGIFVSYDTDGYLVYPLIPPVHTVEDNVTLGFKTYMQTGSLITFLTPDALVNPVDKSLIYTSLHIAADEKKSDIFRGVIGESRGYLPNKPGNGAYVIYTIKPPKRTNTDEMRVAFQTWSKDGPIARVVLADSGFYDVGLVDGKLLVSFNGQQYIPICSPTQTFNDGRMHVVTVRRNNRKFNITVDGYQTQHEPTGFYWNGQYLINERGSLTSDATVMIVPGRQPAPNMEEVVVVLMPHLLHPSDTPRPGPPKPLPDGLPEGSIGGGVVMPGLGTGNVNLGAPIYASDRGYGGGAAGMNAGTGLMLKQAGGLLGMGGLVDALIAGLLLALLLLLSALIWACWRCKPGCCPFCYGKSRGGGSAWNRLVNACCAAPRGTGFVGVDGSLVTREIVLGADRQFKNTFDGVIGGFYWNGQYLINERGSLTSDATVMIVPGRQPAPNMEEVVVVLMPHLLHPSDTPRPGPPKPLPDGLPEGSIGGGVVMPGLGTGNVNLGAPIYASDRGYGGGAAGMNAGTGLMLKQAGGLLGMGGLVDALIAGLLLALLLLLSALIWACWRCKPGCCPFCYGKSRGGGSAWNRLVNACCAAPRGTGFYWNGQYLINERGSLTSDATVMIVPGRQPAPNMEEVVVVLMPHLLHPSDTPRPGPPKPLPDGLPEGSIGGGVVMPGLGTGNVNLGAPIYASAITDKNIYSIDGLKVDCVLITKNSKQFVTGSGMGPPKVWDAQSGEVFKIMEGQELGCTDLHLACDDTVLVTQVVDDLGGGMDTLTDQNAMRVKRMQLWDFVSGRQLEMPMEVMCTSLSYTHKSEHVIVARSSQSGPSILVWNLPANQRDHEIFYDPVNPVLRDNVTYLNISHDDRLVVAGCKNEEQACYMVFDLAAHYPVPAQPRMVVFDAEVNATEILGPDTAVTGTRKGELLVWNLHTGEVVRQIQISATLEGGNMTALAPHSGTVHCIQLSEDGRYLVTGAQDQLVRVWLMPEERLLHTLEGHADDVLSVAISKDSEIVVSGSWDGSIRVWRLRDGNQICWFSSNIEILQVKISNDKRSLVALGERNEHRKLITLRVLRNRVRTTTSLRPAGSRINSSMSPPTPGMSPGSPVMMA